LGSPGGRPAILYYTGMFGSPVYYSLQGVFFQ
jgi:hypothetical protein